MASSRKKQDEKNLKTLRELASQLQNKYCFDCNQRGPTYVNTTIGSFVCTKCSGMLRGLTPPHRVKSISMATFANEEIDMLKTRGNDYCRGVWLGLHEGNLPVGEFRDEQTVKDFMVEKYERKRYYLDPAQAVRNGFRHTEPVKPLTTIVSEPKPIKLTEEGSRKRPEVTTKPFVNFDNVDVFSYNNNNNNNNHQFVKEQESFANFDDNPVFSNNHDTGPILNQVPLFPKCNTNRWSMPTPVPFDNFTAKVSPAATEDKYAALKDLDNALKQNAIDWNSSGSNGSLYNSPTPSGSVYSSPSPQSSMFGSPSQGHFIQDSTFSKPFNGGNNWNSNANPFRENGFSFQSPVVNGNGWGANPFKVGATGSMNPNNPFL